MGDLVNITKAAEIMGVSRWTVRRMVQEGKLTPAARTGTNDRIILLRRSDLKQTAPEPVEAAS